MNQKKEHKSPVIRAIIAYFTEAAKLRRPCTEWPVYELSGLNLYNSRQYVVLRAGDSHVLAVYRIRPANGRLRRLALYPRALDREPRGGIYQKINENNV